MIQPSSSSANPSRIVFAVFGLALVVRLGFWLDVQGTPLDRWHEWDQTDMATYLVQARQLAGVDWLAAEPYHPYHSWQQIAQREKWLEWYGQHQFHQAPAYAYAIALVERVSGNSLPWFKFVQLVIGALTCALAASIAGRLAGRVAAATTGVLAALYGPLFHVEAQLLREGPAAFGLLMTTYLLARFAQRGASPDPRRLVGQILMFAVPLGLLATFHEIISVLAVASLITVAITCARAGARAFAVGLAALALGYLVGFSPLLVRNVLVGAPPLSVSCRTHINFVYANEADAPGGGADFTARGPSRQFVEILDAAGGSFPAAISGVWASYDGDVGRLLGNLGQRFRTIWHPGEVPDNISYGFLQRRVPLLAWLPGFPVVFALGTVGWLLTGWRLRSEGDERVVHAVFALVLFGLVTALTLVHPVARFRLYLVPLLWVYSGIGCAGFIDLAQRRRLLPASALMVVGFAALALQAHWSTDLSRTGPRKVDYTVTSRFALQDGDLVSARELAADAASLFPHKGSYYANLALAHAKRGQNEQALADFERAYAMQPRLANLREALDAHRREVARQTAEPES